MSPDEAANALSTQRAEIVASIEDVEGARTRLNEAPPCGAKPSPEYARALGDLVFGMSRGMVALFRIRKAEIEAALAALASVRTTRQGIVNAIHGRAVQVSLLLMAIGFVTLAMKAESIIKLLKELLG